MEPTRSSMRRMAQRLPALGPDLVVMRRVLEMRPPYDALGFVGGGFDGLGVEGDVGLEKGFDVAEGVVGDIEAEDGFFEGHFFHFWAIRGWWGV